MPHEQPLTYRVLNLARGIAGGYATRLLADLGAACSQLRWDGERPGDWPASAAFREYFTRGTEVVERPFTLAQLLEQLPRLASAFDIVITDFSANEVGDGDLYERVRPFNPAIVIGNVDHYGRSGPYATWCGDELTDYALGGYWAIAGDPERAPLRVPGYQAQFHAGLQLAIGALTALRHARLTGEGQDVEVSAAEAMLGAHWSTTIAWTHEGRVFKRAGADLFEANDGWVFFFAPGLYSNIFILIERPDLLDDPRWNTIAGWRTNGEELWRLVQEWSREHCVEEIVSTAQALRIPVTPMATAASLLADEQLRERGYWDRGGDVAFPGMPYRWEHPWEPVMPASRLGEIVGESEEGPHPPTPSPVATGEGENPQSGLVNAPAPSPRRGEGWGEGSRYIHRDITVEQTPTVTSSPLPMLGEGSGVRAGGPGEGAIRSPLAGLRVLELTNNWAGPIAGRHLGDLGAEVIKVELATKPATRGSHYPGREPGTQHWNRSGYFNEMNRNKRDVALDLSTARGKELFLELVRGADVVVENNSARVMPNLGLGYEALAAVNPRLVMASISGFGATGPARDWVAFGSNIETACGLAAITGYEDEDVPFRTGSFIPDPIAGGHAVVAILAALERRDRTGEGDHIDIALTESAIPFMLESLTYYQEHGALMPRRGNAEADAAPTGAYPCTGTDDWVAIAVRTDERWQALCRVACIDESAYPTAAARVAARAEVDQLVAGWTATQQQYDCARLLQAAGVPAAPIMHNYQLHSDPHLYARQAFLHIEHPDTGVMPYPGFMWRLSRTPASVRSAAPRFAEGNDYVFGTLLGLSADEIAELYATTVTAHEPVMPAPVVL